MFEQRVSEYPVIIHHGKTRAAAQDQFQRLGLHNKFHRARV
jgi:hypothetical protein